MALPEITMLIAPFAICLRRSMQQRLKHWLHEERGVFVWTYLALLCTLHYCALWYLALPHTLHHASALLCTTLYLALTLYLASCTTLYHAPTLHLATCTTVYHVALPCSNTLLCCDYQCTLHYFVPWTTFYPALLCTPLHYLVSCTTMYYLHLALLCTTFYLAHFVPCIMCSSIMRHIWLK